ncbi:MAG TPA: hypothetical protein VKU41_15405 [Polyangiaceae bacterium]|nr:hypothetical protein [Polyangiaceae bacterium]
MRLLGSLLAVVACACGSRTALDVAASIPVEDAADDAGPDVASPPLLVAPTPTSTGRCGPQNCAGCCDSSGACQPGRDEAACGEQGRSCMSCNPRFNVCDPDPTNPDGQVCFSPCNLKSCNFLCCLPNGMCAPGAADDACGNTGAICDDCTARGQTCVMAATGHVCNAK